MQSSSALTMPEQQVEGLMQQVADEHGLEFSAGAAGGGGWGGRQAGGEGGEEGGRRLGRGRRGGEEEGAGRGGRRRVEGGWRLRWGDGRGREWRGRGRGRKWERGQCQAGGGELGGAVTAPAGGQLRSPPSLRTTLRTVLPLCTPTVCTSVSRIPCTALLGSATRDDIDRGRQRTRHLRAGGWLTARSFVSTRAHARSALIPQPLHRPPHRGSHTSSSFEERAGSSWPATPANHRRYLLTLTQ